METGQLQSRNNDKILLASVTRASNAWERLRGLLGRPPLTASQGMLLCPCNSVHTFFMGYPIDVIYLDRELVVRRVVAELRPWRGCMDFGAFQTLELAPGRAAQLGISVGLQLQWISGSGK
jgi:uncharacterized protein